MRTWPSCSRLGRRSPSLPRPRAESRSSDHQRAPRRTRISTSRAARLATSTTTPFRRLWKSVMDAGWQDHRPSATSCSTTLALRMRSTSSWRWAPAATLPTEAVNKLNEMGEKVGLVKRSPVSSLLHQAFRGRHPRDLQDASPCSTVPRSPAPWASRSTSTSAPPSPRQDARHRDRRRPLRPGLQGVHADPC